MIRMAIFLVGLILMAISLLLPFAWQGNDRFNRGYLFDLGLLLAVGSHGVPDGLR